MPRPHIGIVMPDQITHEIIPPALAIKAMRNSGFKSAATAVAELIDNSIQAGIEFEGNADTGTEVELLCLEKQNTRQRQRWQLHKIGVYDNASGMDSATLRQALQFGGGTHLQPARQDGMGRFGMGLPNSSISQCKRLDVYTWQESGQVLHSYLSLSEIMSGNQTTVPEPEVIDSIPDEFKTRIKGELCSHGTLVVWSELDVNWKTANAFMKNSEKLIGRMYRYFIRSGQARIRMASFRDSIVSDQESMVRPNDPLYLMKGTCAEDHCNQPAFIEAPIASSLNVDFDGGRYPIKVICSICKPEIQQSTGGSSDFGRHAKGNTGISLVRANREIELTNQYLDQADTRERWWGIEIKFDPVLDEVFGVTNDKQHCVNFDSRTNFANEAESRGVSENEARQELENEDQGMYAMCLLDEEIRSCLQKLRRRVKAVNTNSRSARQDGDTHAVDPVDVASRMNRERVSEGIVTETDRLGQELPPEVRIDQIAEIYSEDLPSEEARKQAEFTVSHNRDYIFQTRQNIGSSFFQINPQGSVVVIELASDHPFMSNLYQPLLDLKDNPDIAPALNAIEHLLLAWARLENEASASLKRSMTTLREDWGRMSLKLITEQPGAHCQIE